jgi:hypothetical protein
LVDVRLSGEPGLILACSVEREKAESGERPRFSLLWIDAESGRLLERAILDTPDHPEPWLGPLVAFGGRQWALLASREDPASREILELLPVAERSH